jgi:hypothetical protein
VLRRNLFNRLEADYRDTRHPTLVPCPDAQVYIVSAAAPTTKPVLLFGSVSGANVNISRVILTKGDIS